MQDQIKALEIREKVINDNIQITNSKLKNLKKELNAIVKAKKVLQAYESCEVNETLQADTSSESPVISYQ